MCCYHDVVILSPSNMNHTIDLFVVLLFTGLAIREKETAFAPLETVPIFVEKRWTSRLLSFSGEAVEDKAGGHKPPRDGVKPNRFVYTKCGSAFNCFFWEWFLTSYLTCLGLLNRFTFAEWVIVYERLAPQLRMVRTRPLVPQNSCKDASAGTENNSNT